MDSEKMNEERPTGIKDSDDKMHHWHGHHMHGGRMLLGTVIFILILGGVFALGRMSGGRFERVGVERNISINSGFGMRSGFDRGMMGNRFGQEGVNGQITAINNNTLTVKTSSQNITVTVLSTTSIRKSDGTIGKQSDLAVNNNVIVSGPSDSSGNINANFIIIK